MKGADMVEALTVETFKQKVFDYGVNKEWKFDGTLPCVVDFYADWCGPCKMVAPILHELSEKYAGKVSIYKVNTDEQQEIAGLFGIASIPSILFVPVSGSPSMAVGALSKESFEKAFAEILGLAQLQE
jgi:thioredoxin 1